MTNPTLAKAFRAPRKELNLWPRQKVGCFLCIVEKVPIDSAQELFHRQLLDMFSDVDVISNTMKAAQCFKDAFDLLSLQLKIRPTPSLLSSFN